MTASHEIRSRRPYKARLGMSGYVALLGSLHREPADIVTIATRLGWGRDTCYCLIPGLHAMGKMHISGWSVQPRSPTRAVYSFGAGQDVEPTAFQSSAGRMRNVPKVLQPKRIRPELIAFCKVLDEFDGPSTIKEACDATGVDRKTMTKIAKALCQERLARVVRWLPRDHSGGRYVAAYQLGEGPSAAYPNRQGMRRKTAKVWRQRVAANQPMRQLAAALYREAA